MCPYVFVCVRRHIVVERIASTRGSFDISLNFFWVYVRRGVDPSRWILP